jgi:hypothetical protein
VDDYYADPDFKNNHQLFFEIEVTGGCLDWIVLHRIYIQECQAVPAKRRQSEYIVKQMNLLYKELGAKAEQKEEMAWIPVV